MALLEIRGLRKAFERGGTPIVALENLNLSVGEGEFVTIVGPSGCGKSTLLHILGGFEELSGGEVLVNGRAIGGPGRDRGMVFQEFALFPWRTALGNVLWGVELEGRPRGEALEVAERYLEMVGLLPFKDLYPHELSGGMKQRVALARVLAFDPRVLLMDEPFGSLDAQTRELMQEELNRIWEQTGKTVLFVTHDIEEAIYLGDRVLVLTARPGTIKEVVEIKLPRPRDIQVKKQEPYIAYRNAIWDLLREEVLKSRLDVPGVAAETP
ncbi:MAG: ABC transporter ATP-binding protein [Deltaproteobacteria bacterium]|nr:ABC transporter ATP-binding protein [Deltaproteobacteria bacterium]MBI3077648.1 ABC transporter ATP-binding protein [Deltaproteobacteria bacterium]